jgi:DNA-binding CsgD family transcriptional regulator
MTHQFEGTVGPLVEDRLTVVFNDPLPSDDPAGQAVRLGLATRERIADLIRDWRRAGYALEFGIGIDIGYATLGNIGFAGRVEYAAIGSVVHLAGRLCDAARSNEILVSQRVRTAVENQVVTSELGELEFLGLPRAVLAFAVEGLGVADTTAPSRALARPDTGPLTEREREVVALIVRGCTNRQIAEELVIAEGTAVRHVANILNKLGLKSRAQVAVWAMERPHQFARDT